MKINPQTIQQNQDQILILPCKQIENEQEKLKGISSLVKDLKSVQNSKILTYFSWHQIKNQANFLLQYLSRQKISDKILFFETLASFDSLLSIFKANLFGELKFTKAFYRNIQRHFEDLCFELEMVKQEKEQKLLDFQLYSVLFLLVMLIYFSGKKQLSKKKNLPLNIINKTFINSFISLKININQKNQRIIGLILAYMIKQINIKLYGQKMFRFIMHHFDKITSSRTLYHFVYCLKQIHLSREIDVKVFQRCDFLGKLLKFWQDSFYNRQSIYLVDYINIILKKYPSLIYQLKQEQILNKLLDFEKINEFSFLHQGLILEIKGKLLPNVDPNFKKKFFNKAFSTCKETDYSLKYLSCFVSYQKFESILGFIVPFLQSFKEIVRHNLMKSIIFAAQVLNKILDICFQEKAYYFLQIVKSIIEPTIKELKEFNIVKMDIIKIEEKFSNLISIHYQTLY